MLTFSSHEDRFHVNWQTPEGGVLGHSIFVALQNDPLSGSAMIPFGQHREGSTVFVPFRANLLFVVRIAPEGLEKSVRTWQQTSWGPAAAADAVLEVSQEAGSLTISIPLAIVGQGRIRAAAYVKQMEENNGWGRTLPNPGLQLGGGYGDQYVPMYAEFDLSIGPEIHFKHRLSLQRPRIYQLLPRLFGNTNETRKLNGTLAENGCGKFNDINDAALTSIGEFGFTHVWLTGVLQQATATAYPEIPEPADDPDLLKGLAGSPYAVKDCFDVSPDYAIDPANRLAEFQALITRIHSNGMKVIIDFVPNHVARSYRSDVLPQLSFGASDDRTKFFDPRNNFFYLNPEDHGHGPPLRLPTMENGAAVSPTCQHLGNCDGLFTGEMDHGRVTGNNIVSWAPSLTDWYETVKLNYGFDFTTGAREYPHGETPDRPIPDTWLKMDRVLAYWQEIGVDGFRCDMAHMVPPEFWGWAIGRARVRQPDVWFMAEAYDSDPARVLSGNPLLQALAGGRGNVMYDLLSNGFDAVYDDPSYKKLKSIYDGIGWANDLDEGQPDAFIFHNSLRYAENHDEVRLASQRHWGAVGMEVGRAISPILYGMGRGAVMLYSGQEVGEPAEGAQGFSGDDGRTTIFDYWSMPELTKWVNGHRYDGYGLSPAQHSLRAFYRRLLRLVSEPAFREGEFFPLNGSNGANAQFGRLPGEAASGHWLYAFVRATAVQTVLLFTNLHPSETLRDVRALLSQAALDFLNACEVQQFTLTERLAEGGRSFTISGADLMNYGVHVGDIPPLTSYCLEISGVRAR